VLTVDNTILCTYNIVKRVIIMLSVLTKFKNKINKEEADETFGSDRYF
jgi:hypothetical protein